ncbi:hypothetical protein [Candidatus Poriferisodalis sp.]
MANLGLGTTLASIAALQVLDGEPSRIAAMSGLAGIAICLGA